MNIDSSPLKIQEYPLGLWMAGLFSLAIDTFLLIELPEQKIPMLIGGVVFLLFFLLPSILTVEADRTTGLVTITHRSLLRKKTREIPISQIEVVRLGSHTSTDSDGTSTTYRVEIMLKNGEIVPFRSYYSSGRRRKESQAGQLREYLGVGGIDQTPAGLFQMVSQVAQSISGQASATPAENNQPEQVTDGVHWQTQTLNFGQAAVTRWFSPDFKLDESFLFIAQKAADQKAMTGKALKSLGKILFRTAMAIYGFGSDDIPGSDLAEACPLDPRLEPLFMAFTPDPDVARQLLNPWVSMPLVAWAERHPLHTIQSGNASQLVVLYSPKGVYAATLGTLTEAELDELTSLGVELVKSQTSL
jgi:hypothetical protein